MSDTTNNAEKILTNRKDLRNHLQPDEQPIATIPAIWDSGKNAHSETCDIIITNQRLIGYYYRRFPRERLFLDTINLAGITHVTLREKNFSPIFRELLVAEGMRKIYIRTPKQQAETFYSSIRSAIENYAPATKTIYASEPDQSEREVEQPVANQVTTVYKRQTMRQKFDTSPLAVTMLFTGGILLEILGAIIWSMTRSTPTGLPLLVAGFVAVAAAFLIRRQTD